MNHPQIDEQEILARYLLGELSEPEEEDFEDHLLTCRGCQDALEAETRFAGAIRSLDARGELPAPVARSRSWQPLAWAASILFALLPSFFFFRENAMLEQELRHGAEQENVADEIDQLRRQLEAATQPRVNLPLLRLGPVRSAGSGSSEGSPYRLTLSPEPEWIVLVVEPPEPFGESYALRLEDPSGRIAWQQSGVEIDAYGSLTLSLYSQELELGLYRLSATSKDGAPFETAVDIRR